MPRAYSENDIARILFTEEQIRSRVKELGKAISADYAGKSPLAVGVLKSVLPFYTDLLRAVSVDTEEDFIAASSYGNGTVSSNVLTIRTDLCTDIRGRHVLLVEDIADTGRTLFLLKKELLKREPASLKTVCLLNKPSERKFPVEPDYTGFVFDDDFVVGYGLDFAEHYRNLPYIGILKREIYEND